MQRSPRPSGYNVVVSEPGEFVNDERHKLTQADGAIPGLEPIRPLGEGSVGRVLLARDPSLKRLVAVKLLRAELAADPVVCRRFEREAQAAARISHSNVASVYSVGRTADGVPFITMEYIDGRNLADVIAGNPGFDEGDAREILRQLAAALEAAHNERVIHRDVKPANVLIEKGTRRAVLTDFGVAGIEETGSESVTRLTRAGECIGDARYMSPEQLRGETVTGQTDVYSLAIIAYELLTSHGPYYVEGMADPAAAHLRRPPLDLGQLRPDVPRAFSALMIRCLSKRAEQRPSAAELVREMSHETPAASGQGDVDQPGGLPGAFGGFLRELKKRSVYQVAAAYAAASLVMLEVADLMFSAYSLPPWIFTLVVTLALAGFPVAAALAWVYDFRRGRITRTASSTAAYADRTTRAQRIALQILGLALTVGIAAVLGWWLLAA